ncbi:unnamed protein product, partial [Nesidiocoris tenuis]
MNFPKGFQCTRTVSVECDFLLQIRAKCPAGRYEELKIHPTKVSTWFRKISPSFWKICSRTTKALKRRLTDE